MNLLDKKEHYINLFDFYEGFLTEKQKQYFREYYFQDLSLAEMGEAYKVSRNAIYDHLRKIEAQLDFYEEKLGLFRKFNERKKIYREAEALADPELKNIIKKLKELD
ncbi:MAG TPA: hypothetical protein GX692_03990 [Acholeplasmataceae bacterium]|nr:hypothetical protein [Acholeplasmataceae bacterium]